VNKERITVQLNKGQCKNEIADAFGIEIAEVEAIERENKLVAISTYVRNINANQKAEVYSKLKKILANVEEVLGSISLNSEEIEAQKSKRNQFLEIARACRKAGEYESAMEWVQKAEEEYPLTADQRRSVKDVMAMA
jgi:ElaB/YqjD/DUF883 family membrane-anchored ribosome-binding protein